MHEILIIMVTLTIVGSQIFIAYTAWRKIDSYKETIPEAQNFETVKVYIPESKVKDIKIDYILNNLSKFQLPQDEKELIFEAGVTYDSTNIHKNNFDEEHEPGHEDLVWIFKENEEKKIKYNLLDSYEQAGWTKI
ncbi:MAG: hypothetical protein V4581_16130 [Bacteroidota bacterium]